VAKSLWLIISVVILEIRILLSTVVPCQLQKTLTLSRRVDAIGRCCRNALLARVAKEVEVKLCICIFACSKQGHAEDVLVELEGLLVVFNSNHGVVLGQH
jgi:hypothetical protein